ncbi:hypothetical protein ABIE64_001737 [Thalassospira sp. MBR-102]|uniref:hypothetical protein n=1 Tax=Thalassospira sp. MBR-102 TaxID=3156466 RepID=UPI0033999837
MSLELHNEVYDDICLLIWELNVGQGGGWRTTYKGVRRCALFLIHELERRDYLESKGERALERRGLVMSRSLMSAWTYNFLEDCHSARIPPPWELVCIVYALLGCSHIDEPRRGKPDAKSRYQSLSYQNPKKSMRQIARELGVNVTTVRKWKETNQTSSAGYSELRKKLSTLTNEVNFYPPKLRQKPFDVA